MISATYAVSTVTGGDVWVWGFERTVVAMRAMAALVLGSLLVFGCSGSSTSTSTVTAAATPTTAAAPTGTAPLLEPTVTPDPVPAPAAVAATPEVTATALPTATADPEATATALPTSAAAPTATVEPTATPVVSATTVPVTVPTAVAKQDLPPSDYQGDVLAIRTQNGLVLPVRGVTANDYLVVTPCYNLASVTGGLPVSGRLDLLIDPGHGGDEPGAVGPNGLKESTVNLRVAELLRDEMIGRGYTVELTRYSDHRVAIQARAELANVLQPRVFMSIHHNGGFPEPFPVAGTEVFVQLGDPESSRLGGLVFEEVQAALSGIEADWMGNQETFGVAWRQNDDGTDLYGVLRRTPALVSVLTEAMFITTEAEADLLARPEILELEAVALADALVRWFETDEPGSGFIDGIVFQGDLGNGGGTDGCIDPALG